MRRIYRQFRQRGRRRSQHAIHYPRIKRVAGHVMREERFGRVWIDAVTGEIADPIGDHAGALRDIESGESLDRLFGPAVSVVGDDPHRRGHEDRIVGLPVGEMRRNARDMRIGLAVRVREIEQVDALAECAAMLALLADVQSLDGKAGVAQAYDKRPAETPLGAGNDGNVGDRQRLARVGQGGFALLAIGEG